MRGAEAADFLQGQVTNDVEALEPGSGCYATVLNHKGKLRTDLRILRGEDWFWLDTEADRPRGAPAHAEDLHARPRRQYEDVTASRALLSLVGPAARERLDAAPPAEEHAFVEGEHGIYVATDLGVDVIGEPRHDAWASSPSPRRPPSACASSPAGRGSATTWTATRSRRRPASTSAP